MDFRFKAGKLPLLISMPHAGTDIPDDVAANLMPCAAARADTDWHLPELYGFAEEMGASMLSARWSRYLIDLNRPPENTNLYPGQDTTGLCPVDTFGRERLYREGMEPDEAEVRRRLDLYWRPYHAQLRAELDRLLALHGRVVLWEAHSIASQVPRFFEGRLPDLNFGTADGKSCSLALEGSMIKLAQAQDQFSFVFNGRFKGGHITRFYGNPAGGVHAIQLEMVQCLYMNEAAPFDYRPDLAGQVQPLLRELLGAAVEWVRT
ncbi:N-formylglutamate deformylase [Massilia norwichensis]|uniref:N-formylglutamate deformylase n=1 Tax=Massilia norwichensis TaxID=1442366 RepID=A0ABT2A3L4_9BURK|nr:N-formylglutamate deformylase [Massilia norwichensis]MCS0588670.1 N-formylglutamate deformylase [Massilia norwichensis]